MKRILLVGIASLSLLSLLGCDPPPTPSKDDKDSQAQAQVLSQAAREVGIPAITNFAEMRQLKDILERRDKNIPTWTYLQGMDGRLMCMGQSVGYGIPYATQYTNPQVRLPSAYYSANHDYASTPMPQADPNGLFSPASANGTWVQMLNPSAGPGEDKVVPVYIEPNVTVVPYRLTGNIVEKDCP